MTMENYGEVTNLNGSGDGSGIEWGHIYWPHHKAGFKDCSGLGNGDCYSSNGINVDGEGLENETGFGCGFSDGNDSPPHINEIKIDNYEFFYE